MRRGDIRLVDFEPSRPGEANKRRPAVVVSNDRANATVARLQRGAVTVVPLTSNVTRVFDFQVRLAAQDTGLRADSKAQAEQVRAIAASRLGPLVGRVPSPAMAAIDDALRVHLSL